jgi:DNA mismatch repair protein MutS2
LRVADDFLHELINKYQTLHDDLKKREKDIILKANDEALSLLNESNKKIEKTIKEIRENQAEKTKTQAARKELNEFKEQIRSDLVEKENVVIASAAKQKQSTISNQQSTGSPIHQFTNSPVHQTPTPPSRPYQTYIDDLNQKLVTFQMTLDLRGKRAEEALSMLQRYIDDAILLNMHEVQILHGKGNGILHQITREYLKSVKEVKRYQDAPLEQGGAGITVVLFK